MTASLPLRPDSGQHFSHEGRLARVGASYWSTMPRCHMVVARYVDLLIDADSDDDLSQLFIAPWSECQPAGEHP